MRQHTSVVVIGLSGLLGGFWVTACSVSTNGVASETGDASPDASVVDSGAPDTTMPEKDVGVPPMEATVDTGPQPDVGPPECNSSNCNGACCGTKCVSKSCAGCSEGTLFCPYSATVFNSNGLCVSSCDQCGGTGDAGITCFSCLNGARTGSCATRIENCPSSASAGACPCADGDAGACPSPSQVCIGAGIDGGAPGLCVSCGLSGTQGLACANGGACDSTNAFCSSRTP